MKLVDMVVLGAIAKACGFKSHHSYPSIYPFLGCIKEVALRLSSAFSWFVYSSKVVEAL